MAAAAAAADGELQQLAERVAPVAEVRDLEMALLQRTEHLVLEIPAAVVDQVPLTQVQAVTADQVL